MKTLIAAIFIFLLLQACQSSEIGNSKDVNPNAVYRAYTISYTEGDDRVRCVCQCRFGGQNGTTLVLNTPSKFTLDGDTLLADSSVIDGAYYYIEPLVERFEGPHNLVFTDINGKEHPQKLSFTTITCGGLPEVSTAKDIPVAFTGLKDGDVVHTELSDTSNATEDIGRDDTIRNNQLIIRGSALGKLKPGPVTVAFYADKHSPLDNPAKEGGYINMVYRFKERSITLER